MARFFLWTKERKHLKAEEKVIQSSDWEVGHKALSTLKSMKLFIVF